jgi:outer membrane protease
LYSNDIINKQITITSIDTTSHEFVYNSNYSKKISELIWSADDVQMLGIKFDYPLSPKSFIQINYKINLSDDATMDDYDWLKDDTTLWSHWSHHENTILDNFSILDISFNNHIKSTSDIEKNIIIGYKIDKRSFKAYDGTYIYSSTDGFRDLSGSFSGLGISYEETFKMIYFGLSAKKYYPKYILSGKLTYSPKVNITNQDTHHNRYFTNYSTFGQTTMLSIDTTIEYPIKHNISIALNYLNVKYSETKGTTTRTYYDGSTEYESGSVFVYGGAGISNSYSALNLVFIAKF